MGPQQRRGNEPARSSTPGCASQGSHMGSIVLPPSQWPTETRRDAGGSGMSAQNRGSAAASAHYSRPATAGSSRARAQSAERARPRSASSAGRSIPESPVRRPRVRDIPKMYYELPQPPQVEQKVYKPPFWSEHTWGTAECVSPKELGKRGLTRTLSGKNLTLRTRSLNLVSLGEKEKEMKEVMKTRRTLHEGDKQALQRTFRAVARTMVCRVTIEEFVEAWALLGVEVSKEEAASFFHVYGMDKQGLMPYQVFTNALLTLPAKMRGMGAIRRGAFEESEQKEFLGKIMYAKCKTGVFAPTQWDPSLGERSAQVPRASLSLEWIQGYSGHNNVSPNLFYTAAGDMVYFCAAVGIVYNKETHSQKFFLGHTDDIMCLAIHPERDLVATGQNGVIPFVCVWDTRDMSLVKRVDYEEGMRAMVAAAFSPDGRYLSAVATDNNHTIYVHDWQKGKLVFTGRGAVGEPPQVFGICWSPFHPNVWASYGVKHLKFWRLRDGTWQETSAAYGRSAQPFNVLSCVFLPSGIVLAGTLDGQISVWADGKLQYLVDAHADASKLTQMTGAKRPRGLRCITLRSDKCTLLSAGSDGYIHQWDVSSGTLPRNARPINKPGFLSHILRSPHKGERLPTIKGLDCQQDNDNDTFVVGTSKCEIWEVGDDTAEVLVHGHMDDIYTAEWHPKLPNLYVSACESGRVYIWDAIKRRLLRTCSVGFPARSVSIQPGPNENQHIAVGGKFGQTCVVRFSNLEPLFTWKDCANSIDDLKYSPDGAKLATASHDLVIDLYNARDSYTHIARCQGHSATVSHLDWSLDGTVLQSNCNDYEILYWDTRTGRKVTSSMRDVDWATWTCVLGFPVMGIWRSDMDGTDINSCDRSRSRQFVATADDFGRVSLMNYPAVVQQAPAKIFKGHSSHVQNVRFSPDDARVISAGSHDRAVFQWRTHAIRWNANGTIASDPDPLCTEEDCPACGTRPPPPPPPRIWGALDDSGLHFGWVRNDGGTARWSRRTSTLVEDEEGASVGGESEYALEQGGDADVGDADVGDADVGDRHVANRHGMKISTGQIRSEDGQGSGRAAKGVNGELSRGSAQKQTGAYGNESSVGQKQASDGKEGVFGQADPNGYGGRDERLVEKKAVRTDQARDERLVGQANHGGYHDRDERVVGHTDKSSYSNRDERVVGQNQSAYRDRDERVVGQPNQSGYRDRDERADGQNESSYRDRDERAVGQKQNGAYQARDESFIGQNESGQRERSEKMVGQPNQGSYSTRHERAIGQNVEAHRSREYKVVGQKQDEYQTHDERGVGENQSRDERSFGQNQSTYSGREAAAGGRPEDIKRMIQRNDPVGGLPPAYTGRGGVQEDMGDQKEPGMIRGEDDKEDDANLGEAGPRKVGRDTRSPARPAETRADLRTGLPTEPRSYTPTGANIASPSVVPQPLDSRAPSRAPEQSWDEKQPRGQSPSQNLDNSRGGTKTRSPVKLSEPSRASDGRSTDQARGPQDWDDSDQPAPFSGPRTEARSYNPPTKTAANPSGNVAMSSRPVDSRGTSRIPEQQRWNGMQQSTDRSFEMREEVYDENVNEVDEEIEEV